MRRLLTFCSFSQQTHTYPAQTGRHPRAVNPCHLIPWSESATARSLCLSVLPSVCLLACLAAGSHTKTHVDAPALPSFIFPPPPPPLMWSGHQGEVVHPSLLHPSILYQFLYEKPHRWQQKITCPPIHWHDIGKQLFTHKSITAIVSPSFPNRKRRDLKWIFLFKVQLNACKVIWKGETMSWSTQYILSSSKYFIINKTP